MGTRRRFFGVEGVALAALLTADSGVLNRGNPEVSASLVLLLPCDAAIEARAALSCGMTYGCRAWVCVGEIEGESGDGVTVRIMNGGRRTSLCCQQQEGSSHDS